MHDIHCYSTANVLRQIAEMIPTQGFYEVRFYANGKRPSKEKTDVIATFYYYPSGGTLRDADMNIVFYEPRLDQYRSFKAPRGDAPEA